MSLTALPAPVSAATRTQGGYWMLTANGEVHGFGGAANLGRPMSSDYYVHLAPTPTGEGYWTLHPSGVVQEFGDATDLGSSPSLPFDEDYTTLAPTPTGKGYWLFTDKGRVFRFGDATFHGDMSGVKLNGPVLDAVATPSGKGYYMVGSDGGVFSFGDATFHGSTGNMKLNKPVMSMAPDPDGAGYWLVASDGGIFAFDAPFHGSTGHIKLNKPISGIVGSPTGGGYLMVAEDGGVFSFGDVPFHGSLGSNPPAFPVVAIAAIGDPGPPPVYEWREVLDNTIGSSEGNTAPFELSTQPAMVTWICADYGTYSYGCSFRVINFDTGEWLESWMPDGDTDGTMWLHPKKPGRYYIYSNEFGDNTTWGFAVDQQVCVQNCR
jgi:hypothetical protein